MAMITPLTIIRSQYFLYFAVMGAVLPYFNLYCYHIGFSGYQIGALSAVRSLTVVIFPIFWGILADRLNWRRSVYVICNFLSVAIWAGYFFSTQFTTMVWITLAYGIFYTPIIALLETTTMETLGENKSRYGQTRVWGSISFIIVVLLLGRLIDRWDVSIILGIVLAGSLIQAIMALGLPKAKPNPTLSLARSITRIGSLFSSRFILYLGCACFMLVSHGAYYGFFSIHLENLGLSGGFIGMAWALASLAEIVVMITSARMFLRFTPEKMMLFAFGMASLRWIVLGLTRSPGIILLSQGLHAFSYGVFHVASILYVDRLSSPQDKALGQALNNSVTYGLGLMIGFYLAGWIYAHTTTFSLFFLSAGIAAGSGIVFQIGVAGRQAPTANPGR